MITSSHSSNGVERLVKLHQSRRRCLERFKLQRCKLTQKNTEKGLSTHSFVYTLAPDLVVFPWLKPAVGTNFRFRDRALKAREERSNQFILGGCWQTSFRWDFVLINV